MSLRHRLGFTPPAELVEGYLHDDETIIFAEAPDVRIWMWDHVLELVALVAALVIMAVSGDPLVIAAGLLGEVILLGSLLRRFADLVYTRYVLTDFRALRLSGVFRRDYEWIAWKKVTDVSVHRSLADRWFGTATIRIQSANEQSKFKAMDDVPNPVMFAETIVELVNGAR